MISQKEIFEKYPKIFGDKDKPMTETCMCWGLEVPQRWLPIIDELCDAMTNFAYTMNTLGFGGPIKFPQVVAEQVKSKFNKLRFYYRLEYEQEGIPEEVVKQHYGYIDGMIAYAENRIYRMEKDNKTN
jgi:hypothetical protein